MTRGGEDVSGESDQPPPEPARPGTSIELSLSGRPTALDLDQEWLELRLRAAVEHLDREVRAVTLCIVDDERMSQLHQAHCGLSSTTDVLTFELSEPGEPLEVDLAVCLDEARRQARDRGHSIEQELLLYGVHGLLHCCGHDDHSRRGFELMHEREDEILRAIGVTATFHALPGSSAEPEGDQESRPLRKAPPKGPTCDARRLSPNACCGRSGEPSGFERGGRSDRSDHDDDRQLFARDTGSVC